jgi:hypothetical protein
VVGQGGDHAAGLAFAGAEDRGDVAALQFAAIEHDFENGRVADWVAHTWVGVGEAALWQTLR